MYVSLLFICLESCDIYNMTSVDVSTNAIEIDIKLEHGIKYFTTLVVTNGAGLVSRSSSNGLTIDMTAPIVKKFSVTVFSLGDVLNITSNDDLLYSTNPWDFQATWENIFDDESNITNSLFCVENISSSCNLIPWTNFDFQYFVLNGSFPNPLKAGALYYIKIRIENGAGLKTVMQSNSVMIDYTAPLASRVKVGTGFKTLFLRENQPLIASWDSSFDHESGMDHYEWKICYSDDTSLCLSSFINVQKQRSLVIENVPIEHGKPYVLIVNSVNKAGVGIHMHSPLFILDDTFPEPGIVADGNEVSSDKMFQSSSSDLTACWRGFQDIESGITRYKICIGSSQGICDIQRYRTVGLNHTFTFNSLSLIHNSTYFVTVEATNGAGDTSVAYSDGVTVDQTLPVGGNLRDGQDEDIDFTEHESSISANWDEFFDPETGVVKYVICAGSTSGACDIFPLTDVTGQTMVNFQVRPAIPSGTTVFMTLTVYNGAGGALMLSSDGVTVNREMPILEKVGIKINATDLA